MPHPPTDISVDISVIMPAYNEAPNLAVTVPSTLKALADLSDKHELIVVDDGSRDETTEVLADLLSEHPNLRVRRHRRNLGKSEALTTGFASCRGDIVVLMDADGQDDPTALRDLVDKIHEGTDLVTGRRAVRHDRFIKRRTSQVYNWVTAKVTGVPGKDFNSGFKAMRREVVEDLSLYGELHRYIPVLASWAGFTVAEVDVPHHERLYGTSKFGIARFWRGLFDLVTVKFITNYTARPFHFFGAIGAFLGAIGVGLLAWMAEVKISGHGISNRPALLIGILFVVVSVQVMAVGLIGELIVYHRDKQESRSRLVEPD